jgi:hypothetical protein
MISGRYTYPLRIEEIVPEREILKNCSWTKHHDLSCFAKQLILFGDSGSYRKCGAVGVTRGKKMQFLFDYGDDHRFELEARGFDETMPGVVYPRLMSAKGERGPQYLDYKDEDLD